MTAKDNADTFVFYPTFLTSIEAIKSDAVQLAMFRAVVNYGLYGTLPDFSGIDPMGILDAVFVPIRYAIDGAKARRDCTNEMQRLKQLLRWGKITQSEYNNRIKSLTETKHNGNTTGYSGIIGNTEHTYNVNVDVNADVNKPSKEGKAKSVSRFVAPTLEDIEAYCREKGYKVDAAAIYDHYTANGWVQGKNKPIKDWRAAVRQWARREKEFAKPQPQSRNDARRGTDVSQGDWGDWDGAF